MSLNKLNAFIKLFSRICIYFILSLSYIYIYIISISLLYTWQKDRYQLFSVFFTLISISSSLFCVSLSVLRLRVSLSLPLTYIYDRQISRYLCFFSLSSEYLFLSSVYLSLSSACVFLSLPDESLKTDTFNVGK